VGVLLQSLDLDPQAKFHEQGSSRLLEEVQEPELFKEISVVAFE